MSVSVLEALAHGCIPLLSDLPANHELVHRGDDSQMLGQMSGQMPGWVARGDSLPGPAELQPLLDRADAIAARHHAWVAGHAMFGPSVARFLARLRALDGAAGR